MRARTALLLIGAMASGLGAGPFGCRGQGPRSDAPRRAVALPARVQGANLRAVGDERRGYGTRKARETMRRLGGLGVNTISVLMEGRMGHRADPEVRPPSRGEVDSIRTALEDANAQGFATVLIPHLYLDDGTWRGEIALDDAELREKWWRSYGDFIELAADLAASSGTTVLSIGVELKGLSARIETRAHMAALLARVRRVFGGVVTYSANWDEAETVAFWDLVDVAGVNGYYPLAPDPERGAEAVGRRLAALAALAARDVLVLEVGYRAGPMSHVKPWEWPEHARSEDVDEVAQAKAWAAVLSTWPDVAGVRGVMVWVIPTDPDDPASERPNGFSPMNRAAEEVIRRAFTRSPGTLGSGGGSAAP